MANLDFADLVAPHTVDDFFTGAWERAPLHLVGDPDRYRGLLGIDDLERLIAAAPDLPGQRGVIAVRSRDGGTAEHPVGSEQGGRQMAQIYQAFDDGYTIVINQLARFDRRVSQLCADATEQLQHVVGANLYFTPSDAQGFVPHRDFQDTFFLQIAGTKYWSLWEPEHRLPRRPQNPSPIALPTTPPTLEVKLEAGDLLYMPRGWIHAGHTSSEHSLHVTLGARVTTGLDVLAGALARLADDNEVLRRALPLRGVGAQGPSIDEILEALNTLAGPALERALNATLAERAQLCIPPLTSGFDQVTDRENIGLTTQIRRHRGLVPIVSDLAGHCRLTFPGTHVDGPLEARAAFDHVARHSTFRVADLPGLPDEARIALANQLVLQGCVKRVAEGYADPC